jgi:hypothetical protein
LDTPRTAENAVRQKFAELSFHTLRSIKASSGIVKDVMKG